MRLVPAGSRLEVVLGFAVTSQAWGGGGGNCLSGRGYSRTCLFWSKGLWGGGNFLCPQVSFRWSNQIDMRQ